jgi:serine/threonine-protein kinase
MDAAGNKTGAHKTHVPAAAIREELDRVLASQTFAAAIRRTRLLRFLVEEALLDRGDSLKESVIATEVFDRPPDYDPKLDSIVRVEMGRLRSRLTQYYSNEGVNDPVRIEIPKGSYQPAFVFAETTPSGLAPPSPAKRRAAARVAIAACFTLALCLAAILVWRFRGGFPATTASLAVLPFLNLSGEPSQDYLADSLTDELTEALAESKDLRVVARTSAFQFKGKSQDIRAIGRALNAAAVLESSVSIREGEYRLVVQLIRTADGYHIWSRTYESSAADLPRVETEIAQSACQALLPSRKAAALAVPVGSPNPEAHDLYMRAIYQLQLHTPESLRESLRLSQQAVRIDPEYARAYFAIARAATSLSAIGVISGREATDLGRPAVRKALAIDPNFSDAHAFIAYSLYVYDWNWPEAEKEFALALQAGGSHSQAHSLYGWSLMTRKRFAEARSHLEIAEDLDPQSPGARQNLVNDLVFERNFPAAKHEIAGIFKLYPKSLVGVRDLGLIAIWERDCAAARSAAETAAAWYPDQSDRTGSPAMKARCGQPAEARRQLEKMADEATTEFVSPYSMAQGYASLGDADRALEYLQKSADARESVVLYIGVDALFDLVRKDPRFVKLEKQIGLIP